MPAFCISGSAIASGSRPASCCASFADRRAVRLHADGVDHRVGPTAVGHVRGSRPPRSVSCVAQVEHLDPAGRGRARGAPAPGRRRSRGRAAVQRDARGHVADRPEAEHHERCRRPAPRRTRTACQAVGRTSER